MKIVDKTIFIIFLLSLFGCSEKSNNDDILDKKMIEFEKQIDSKTDSLMDRTNADYSWYSEFNNSTLFDDLLSIELERFWIKSQPILFRGNLTDIRTIDPLSYEVIIEWTYYIDSYDDFTTDGEEYVYEKVLQLKLISSKSLIDNLLTEHARFLDYRYKEVAVIAKINSIESGDYFGRISWDAPNYHSELKIGIGELLEIISTTNPEDPLSLFTNYWDRYRVK